MIRVSGQRLRKLIDNVLDFSQLEAGVLTVEPELLPVQDVCRAAFAERPRDAADYQRGYDAFLEKELQNPRGLYYSSSHVWMTAVDDLGTKVACAEEQGQVLSHRIVRRAMKLLHMQPERMAASLTPADPPAGASKAQPRAAAAPSKRPGSHLGAGLWHRLSRRR